MSKLTLEIRSRPIHDPLKSRHLDLQKSLRRWKEPWKCDLSLIGKIQTAPPFAGANLRSCLPKGFTGSVHYNDGWGNEDDGQYDDFIEVAFDAKRFDAVFLVDCVPTLVEGFSAYLAELQFESTTLKDFEDRIVSHCRREFGRFGIYSFLDKELCQRAFDLTPRKVSERLAGPAVVTKLLAGGVSVQMLVDGLEESKIAEMGANLRNLLPNSPFRKSARK